MNNILNINEQRYMLSINGNNISLFKIEGTTLRIINNDSNELKDIISLILEEILKSIEEKIKNNSYNDAKDIYNDFNEEIQNIGGPQYQKYFKNDVRKSDSYEIALKKLNELTNDKQLNPEIKAKLVEKGLGVSLTDLLESLNIKEYSIGNESMITYNLNGTTKTIINTSDIPMAMLLAEELNFDEKMDLKDIQKQASDIINNLTISNRTGDTLADSTKKPELNSLKNSLDTNNNDSTVVDFSNVTDTNVAGAVITEKGAAIMNDENEMNNAEKIVYENGQVKKEKGDDSLDNPIKKETEILAEKMLVSLENELEYINPSTGETLSTDEIRDNLIYLKEQNKLTSEQEKRLAELENKKELDNKKSLGKPKVLELKLKPNDAAFINALMLAFITSIIGSMFLTVLLSIS